MKMLALAFSGLHMETLQPTAIQTTLYDLIASISEAVEPDEEDLIMPTVRYLLHSHRAQCFGYPGNSRLICVQGDSYAIPRHARHNPLLSF